MAKTDTQILSDILNELRKDHTEAEKLKKIDEAFESLESIEDERKTDKKHIASLKKEISDLEDKDPDEAEYDNEDFLGLDTLRWSLVNGNLRVQEQVGNFVERIKEQNCVTGVVR